MYLNNNISNYNHFTLKTYINVIQPSSDKYLFDENMPCAHVVAACRKADSAPLLRHKPSKKTRHENSTTTTCIPTTYKRPPFTGQHVAFCPTKGNLLKDERQPPMKLSAIWLKGIIIIIREFGMPDSRKKLICCWWRKDKINPENRQPTTFGGVTCLIKAACRCRQVCRRQRKGCVRWRSLKRLMQGIRPDP